MKDENSGIKNKHIYPSSKNIILSDIHSCESVLCWSMFPLILCKCVVPKFLMPISFIPSLYKYCAKILCQKLELKMCKTSNTKIEYADKASHFTTVHILPLMFECYTTPRVWRRRSVFHWCLSMSGKQITE
jgi:hypothetical protein